MKDTFLIFLRFYLGFGLTTLEKSVRWELLNKHSFRIPENLNGSWRTFPQFLKKAFSVSLNCSFSQVLKSEVIVLDSSPNTENERREYLNISQESNVQFIFRQALPNDLNIISKLFLVIKLLCLCLIILPRFVFVKNREKTAHLLLELVECELILLRIKKHGCDRLFVFGAFEKDASFYQYVWKLNGVSATIIPSSNPISLYYKTVIASSFAFTAPYQAKEFEKLSDNWHVDLFLKWPPFEYYKIPHKKADEKSKYELGFMSSGMHLREKLGFTKVRGGELNRAESKLISMLKRALDEKVIYNLVVYLHPLEKRNESNLKVATKFYKDAFGEQIIFGSFDCSSRDSFSEVEIAISGFSSVLMERLYGGHKIIFAPMGELQNFYQDKRLEKLSVNSLNQFMDLYSITINQSEKEFFTLFELHDYLNNAQNTPNIQLS